jgi:hypothetical protein
LYLETIDAKIPSEAGRERRGTLMQYVLWVRRYAPFYTFGGGFEGDGERGPSASEYVTARTIGCVIFGRRGIGKPVGSSSGTDHWLWPGDRVFADVRAKVTVQTRAHSTLRFILHTEGSNPLVPGISPDIDTDVHITVNMSDAGLALEGQVKGDDFPNAEVFITDEKRGAVLLFHYETTGGAISGPATHLMGSHSGQSLGGFVKRISLNGDGSIHGVLVNSGPHRVPIGAGPVRRVPISSGPARRVPIRSGP